MSESLETNKSYEFNEDSTTNLQPEWENQPKLADFKANLKGAKPLHDRLVSQINDWLTILDGGSPIKKKIGKSSLRSKITKKQAEWVYSSLSEPFLSTPELFSGEAVSSDDADFVEESQKILNFHIKHNFDLVGFIDEMVRNLVDNGTAILKPYWLNTTTTISEKIPKEILTAPNGQRYVEEWITQHRKISIEDSPQVELCKCHDVIVDPTCKGIMSRCQFIAHQAEFSMGDLESSGKYTNLDKILNEDNKNSEISDIDSSDNYTDNFTFGHDTNKKIKVIEYWGFYDIHNNGTLESIVCSWVGDTMIQLELSPYEDKKLPFIFIQYSPIKDSFYGESIAELTGDSQKIIGAMTRGILDMMGRSSNSQTIITKGIFDEVNARRFERGEDVFANPFTKLQDNIMKPSFPEIPASAIQVINMNISEVESFTGVKPFAVSSVQGNVGDSATQVRSSMDATAKRELAVLRRIASGLVSMGNKFLAMCADVMDYEEITRITGNETAFIKEEKRIKYDIALKISTPEADQNKIDKLSFMLQTISPNADPGIVKNMHVELFKLQKLFELAKQTEEYEPQPDPIQQEKAVLEIKLLEAQVQNELAKGVENQIDGRLKEARARLLHSQSDTTDLDFVEKESGVERAQKDKEQDKNLYAEFIKNSAKETNNKSTDKKVNKSNSKNQ